MKINFVGDIGIFSKYEALQIDPFGLIELPSAHLNVGNFEFVIPKKKQKFFYDVQERYSCSYEYFTGLDVKKFQGLGLANNHCMDYGLKGALETIEHLEKSGIQVFGFSQDSGYSIGRLEADGTKIGIIACASQGRWSKEKYGFGPDTYDAKKIRKTIAANLGQFDHIVVFPHWGTELLNIPKPEDVKNARIFIDEGASAVIGHHPHVSQGIEQYKNGLIAYSLGSFIYVHEDELGYSGKNSNRMLSICLNVDFGKNDIAGFHPYYYKYNRDKIIPEPIDISSIADFVSYLNNNIHNRKLYKQEIRKVLLRREMLSFWERFKSHPLQTMFSYTKYAFKKIVKLF